MSARTTYLRQMLLTFKEAITQPASQVGNKVIQLARLAKDGYDVPPAIILPSKIWRVMCEPSLEVGIFKWEAVEAVWGHCKQYLGSGPWIVRSSGGQEDGSEFSFAGQFVSVPNVFTIAQLREALFLCRASGASERVRAYSQAIGNGNTFEQFAVMIMPQRQCSFSGILFSNVQLNGSDQELVVLQMKAGDNFQLTDGSATGDLVYMDKSNGRIVYSECETDSSTYCDHVDLAKLHKLANNLESHLGYEVDVEWGMLPDGTLEVFQVRPITTKGGASTSDLRLRIILQTVKSMNVTVDRLAQNGVVPRGNWWSNQNIAELITDNPSRMAFGVFTYIFANGQGAIRTGRNEMGYDIGTELEEGFFELIGGRPRCSIVHDALTYRIKGIPLEDYASGFVQRYLSFIAEDIRLANYPEVVLYEQNPSRQLLIEMFGEEKAKAYSECYDRFFVNIRRLEGSVASEFVRSFEPIFRQYIDEQRKKVASLVADTSISNLVTHGKEVLDHLRTMSCVMFVKVARLGFFAYARLRRRLEAVFGEVEGRHLLDEMTAGLEDDSSMLFNVRLAAYRDGKITLSELVDEFGHLGPNELEIANPRYRNQVSLIEQLAASIQGDPIVELRMRANQAQKVAEDVMAKLDSGEASELQQDLIVARSYLAMRERVKYFYLMEYDILRQILVRLAELIGVEKHLIFELDPRELDLVVNDPARVALLVQECYRERTLVQHLYIPPVLSLEDVAGIGKERYDPDAKVLMGIGITPLVTTGIAVVVLDPHDTQCIGRLSPGCVLVTKTTDPTWAPIIAAVGGNGALVTEIGGPLAHGAIVARDLGIACVQNVPGATRRIKTGDLIEVDGKHGTVKLVSEGK